MFYLEVGVKFKNPAVLNKNLICPLGCIVFVTILFFYFGTHGWFYLTTRAAVVHLNFRAGSTFPVPVCTVSPRHWVNKADTQSD